MPQLPYIERDYAGFGGHTRFTHYPSGDTCLRQPYMDQAQWFAKRDAYLAKYVGLGIYDGRGALLWTITQEGDQIRLIEPEVSDG